MKLRNYLETISGVGIFPVISLTIFFAFFALLTFWVLRSRKNTYKHVSNMPLEDGTEN